MVSSAIVVVILGKKAEVHFDQSATSLQKARENNRYETRPVIGQLRHFSLCKIIVLNETFQVFVAGKMFWEACFMPSIQGLTMR